MVAAARHHQIVDDPALVEQQRIRSAPSLRTQVGGQQRLQRAPARAGSEAAHVADVEQPADSRVQRCSAMMPSYWIGIE
jgi:hypothetical protein